jgi:hypothetical protein
VTLFATDDRPPLLIWLRPPAALCSLSFYCFVNRGCAQHRDEEEGSVRKNDPTAVLTRTPWMIVAPFGAAAARAAKASC